MKNGATKKVLDIFRQPTLRGFQKCTYFQKFKLSKVCNLRNKNAPCFAGHPVCLRSLQNWYNEVACIDAGIVVRGFN